MKLKELIERIKRLDESYLKRNFFKINRTTRRTRNRSCRRSSTLPQKHTSTIARVAIT